MTKKSPLDDPQNAAFAWARYRRIMRFMLLLKHKKTVAHAPLLMQSML